MSLADIGLIGLAVMGSNLALNIAEKGYTVAVNNRSPGRIDDFVKEAEAEGLSDKTIAKYELADFVAAVKKPRSIIIMVKAGAPVDAMIEQLLPLLDEGDSIIECGNSLYTDTTRRFDYLKPKGIGYLGVGVSGGEEGSPARPLDHGRRRQGAVAQCRRGAEGDLGQVRRRTVLRLSRRGRGRPFRQDHP